MGRNARVRHSLQRFTESGRTAEDLIALAADPADRSPHELPDRPPGGMTRSDLASLLDEFAKLALAPYRTEIQTRLGSDIDAYRQIMSASGVETLLRSLHPRIHWRAPVLEIEGPESHEIELGGRGLLVSPSLFLTNPGTLLPSVADSHDPSPTLVFPVRPDPRASIPLGAGAETTTRDSNPEAALAMLMGRTRAALLEELRRGCANGELADRVGVSAAAVSQHTSVLRAAGLITTRRTRNLVLHTVTPLGRSLLGSGPRTPAPAVGSQASGCRTKS
ncbi:ArsR/SmtB family transcription factor [Kitasatospora albolonga]|uniref:ArsR/SmtB family transcription factor n=1 Tax=Streptomycetaceae TaxID=2062 RepID=UPI00131DF48E